MYIHFPTSQSYKNQIISDSSTLERTNVIHCKIVALENSVCLKLHVYVSLCYEHWMILIYNGIFWLPSSCFALGWVKGWQSNFQAHLQPHAHLNFRTERPDPHTNLLLQPSPLCTESKVTSCFLRTALRPLTPTLLIGSQRESLCIWTKNWCSFSGME